MNQIRKHTLWAVPAGLSLIFATAVLTSAPVADWAFARHANTLSWVVRPLLLLPLVYAAWRRSLAGIFWSVFAILTSMVWFPAPNVPREDVLGFLAREREILDAGWTWANLFGLVSVVIYTALLARAFWVRSWRLGLVVAGLGAVGKMLWSVIAAPETGAAIAPFAVGGFVVMAAIVLATQKRRRT